MRNKVWRIFILIALWVLAGCQPAPPVPENPERNLATPFTGELSEADQRTWNSIDAHVVALARADLAQKQGIDADSIFVQSVEETEFSDASLGVPEPGVMYAQVVTPGYVIRLIAGGKVYRYHVSGDRVVLVPDRETPSQETPHDTIAVNDHCDRVPFEVETKGIAPVSACTGSGILERNTSHRTTSWSFCSGWTGAGRSRTSIARRGGLATGQIRTDLIPGRRNKLFLWNV